MARYVRDSPASPLYSRRRLAPRLGIGRAAVPFKVLTGALDDDGEEDEEQKRGVIVSEELLLFGIAV